MYIVFNENKSNNKFRFKLPSIDLLKVPTKKNKEQLKDNDFISSEFLEKILLTIICYLLVLKLN